MSPSKSTQGKGLISRLKSLVNTEQKHEQSLIEQSHQATVRFESMEPRVLLAGDTGIVAVSGSIAVQGEQDQYEFTLESTHRVVFDNLSNRQDITWRLENEQGLVIDNLALAQTESYMPLAELAAGHYRLTVDGVGDARGDYQLRLIDVNGAEDLVMGQTITGQLVTGKETQVYRVNAQAGESFYFQSLLSTQQVTWRLIDPDNNIEVSSSSFYRDKDTTRLQKSGQYLLLVEGDIHNTTAADYRFIWHKVEQQPQSLSLDQLTTANINTIGQKAIFNFSLTEPRQVLLNALSQTPFTWQLTGTQGTVISERGYQAQSEMAYPYALLSLLAGDYQLTLDVSGTTTASIPFSLLTTETATLLTTQQVYQQHLDAAQSQLLKINLEQGEKLRVDASAGLTWQLIDRFGLAVTSSANPVIDVTDSGLYYLRLHATQIKDYQLSLTPIADMVHSINANGVIAGQLNQLEQISHYDFSLVQASSVSLTVEQNLTGLMYRLVGPRGEEQAWQSINNLNLAYLPQGQYRLSLKSSQALGDYSLTLNSQAIVAQPVSTTGEALALNQAVAAVLPETGTQHYSFSLSEDSLLWMDVLASSSARWSLVGPKGVEINQQYFYYTDAPYGRTALSLLAGDYLLTVEGYANEAYSFRVLNAADTPHLTLNQATLVDISPVSSNVIYQFEAQANQAFVLTHGYDSLSWLVYDAYGKLVPLSYDNNSLTFTVPKTGQYYLSIEGAYYQTGSSQAQFTLYQPQMSTVALTLNDRLSASLDHRFDQVNYQFTVDKPEVFVLDSLVNNNSASVEWQLTGSQGQIFNWQSLSAGQGARLLQAGRYTLSLRNIAEQAASYQVAVLNRQAATPLTFAQAQQADLSQGQQTLYRFTAQAGESLYLQGDWNNSWNSRWTLFNGYGQEVLQDYTRGNKPQVPLTTTGEYLLVLSSSSSQDQVSFTVWSRTVIEQSLSLNTPIQATLTQPAQVHRYLFSVDAKQTLYIAPHSNSQTQYWQWRLVNNQGQVLQQNNLTTGGFYYLSAGSYYLEVNANDLSTGEFSFQVFEGSQLPQIALNQAQIIHLNPQQQQQVYRFNITDNDKFLINSHELAASSQWQLVNARGQLIGSGYAGDLSAEPLSLTTGDYYLLVNNQGLSAEVTGQISIHPLTIINHSTQLDTQWHGSISEFGQRQAYVFEISQATTVLLDYLNQGGDFIWQLSGPEGQLYDYLGLADSRFQFYPFVLSKAGQYTLTVRSKNAATGDFNFSLRDLSQAASLSQGQQALTFDAAQSQLWTVNAQAGQTLVWRMSNPPSEAFYLAAFNAQGQLITGSLLAINDAVVEQQISFAQTGQYYLQFAPEYASYLTGQLTVDVNIQLLGQQSQVASLEQVMVGQSRASNFAESWTFNLNHPTRLLFDGLIGLNHQVSLYTSAGQLQYQGLLADSALWQLAAGAYRLEVIASDHQVLGDYQFKLTDIAAAPLLSVDQTVTVNPMGEQAQVYRIHSPMEQLLALQLQASTNGSGKVSLYDASGNLLIQANLQDTQGAFNGEISSDYREKVLVIERLSEETQLVVESKVETVVTLPELWLGQSLTGHLAQTGDIISYHLNVAQGQSLPLTALVQLSPLAAVAWQVHPWGQSQLDVWSDEGSDGDSLFSQMLNPGEYVFSLIARQDNVDYHLQLLDSQAPQLLHESISTNLAAQSRQVYAIDLAQEQTVAFTWQVDDSSAVAYWLYDENGNLCLAASQADDLSSSLLSAGRYLLVVENLSTQVQVIHLSIDPVVSYSPVSTPLVFNQSIQGGQQYQQPVEQAYAFHLPQATKIVIDLQQAVGEYLAGDGYTNAELHIQIKRHGIEVYAETFYGTSGSSAYRVIDLASGDYELYLSAPETNNYQLTINDLWAVSIPVDIAETINQSTSQGQLQVYRFDATANQAIYLNFEGNVYGSTWRLLDEYGHDLGEGMYENEFSTGSNTLNFSSTGSYYLLIDNEGQPEGGGDVDIHFSLEEIVEQILPVELNTLTINDFNSQGFIDYQFSIDTAKTLWFDADSDPDFGQGMDVDIRDEFGVLVYQSQQGQAIILAKAGTYTLHLSNTTGDNSRQAQFILADISQPNSANLGDSLSGTLTPAQGVVAYQFTVSQNNPIKLLNSLSDNTDDAHRWMILDQYGHVIKNGRLENAETVLNLAVGSYRLVIDSQHTTDDLNYQLQLVEQTPIVPISLVLNQIVTTSLAAKSMQKYSLHIAQGGVYVFDGLNSLSSASWYLRDVQGQFLFFNGFNNNQQDAVRYLASGDYDLVLHNDSNQTASFEFQVLDSQQAAVLTQGQQRLNPVSTAQANVYQVNLVAGERYFWDILPFSYLSSDNWGEKPNLSWQLVDETGHSIFTGDIGYYQNTASQYSYEHNQWQYVFTFIGHDQELIAQKTGRYSLVVQANQVANAPDFMLDFVQVPRQPVVPLEGFIEQAKPDLTISPLVITPNQAVQTGDVLQVQWTVSNKGNAPVNQQWHDHIVVKNADTEQVLLSLTVPYDALQQPLAQGQSLQRSQLLQLPANASAAGRLSISVIVDADNYINEAQIGIDAEQNNRQSSVLDVALAAYPDLVAQQLTISPASNLQPNQTVTVSWQTVNQGQATAQGTWQERVEIRHLSSGQLIDVLLVNTDNTHLVVGEEIPRSVSFTWPSGLFASGEFDIRVVVDALQQVSEANASQTAESNNQSSFHFWSGADLTIQNLALNNTQLQAGDLVSLTWQVHNQGNSTINTPFYEHIRVYHSQTGRVLLDTSLVYEAAGQGAIASNQAKDRQFNFYLPEGVLGAGEFTVEVTTDQNSAGLGQIYEVNEQGHAETNNQQSLVVTASAKAYADLVVSDWNSPSIAIAGQAIDVAWWVKNQGQVASQGRRQDVLVLSRDPQFGNGDDVILANVYDEQALAIDEQRQQQSRITLPQLNAGRYYLAIRTNVDGAVLEPDTQANNLSVAHAIDISQAYTDLVVSNIQVAEQAQSGETIAVTWTVTNVGNQITDLALWSDRIVLSRDAVVSSDDVVLAGNVTHLGQLAPNQQYTGRATLTLPRDVSGDFYLIVNTNQQGTVTEKDHSNNNTLSQAIRINLSPVADLTATILSAPTVLRPNQAATLTYTLNNQGNAPTNSVWRDRLFVVDSQGQRVEVASVMRTQAIAANDSHVLSLDCIIPHYFVEGEYTWVLEIDSDNSIYERHQENNNSASTPLSIRKVDLQVSAIQAPSLLVSGQTLDIQWTVNNLGAAIQGTWVDEVYLNQNGQSTKLGEVSYTGSLATGENYQQQFSYQTPLSLQGEYEIVIVTDSKNALDDSSRLNNQNSKALQVDLAAYADLVVTDVQTPSQLIADPALLTVSWTVKNQGTGIGQQTTWTDKIVLSNDSILGNGDDRLLTEVIHNGALTVDGAYQQHSSVYLPPALSGRFKLFVVSDAKGQVFENQLEANNVVVRDLDVMTQPYADLQVESVSTIGQAYSGKALTVSWTVANLGIGITSTTSWQDNVYLSTDIDGKQGIIPLAKSVHLGALGVDDRYSQQVTVEIPEGLSGTYYLQVQTGGAYEFIYDTNNRRGIALPITLSPSADLIVDSITVPSTAQEGGLIDVAWTVLNQGDAATEGQWQDSVYLVPLSVGATPVLLGSYTYNQTLASGIRYTRTEQLRLPSKIVGLYRLQVVTNAVPNVTNRVYEHGAAANNNTRLSDENMTVTLNDRPDLCLTAITVPDEAVAGGSVAVRYTVSNLGAGAATGRWQDKVY